MKLWKLGDGIFLLKESNAFTFKKVNEDGKTIDEIRLSVEETDKLLDIIYTDL